MAIEPIDELKILIREDACPFFSPAELEYYLANSKNVREAAYKCLLIKAENTTLSVSGLNAGDTSQYFRRLASQYRPNNSKVLGG